MSADPAALARERAEEVARLLAKAEELEAEAAGMKPSKLEDAVTLGTVMAGATNLRVQAICLHLRLPTRDSV